MAGRLKDVTNIRSGVFATSKTNPVMFYLQSTDFDQNRQWKQNLKPTLSLSDNLKRHTLQHGDVLFVSKGRDFFAVMYDGAYAPAVATTTFLVIDTDKTKLLPEFLVWYLNHPNTKAALKQLSRGSSIPMISKNALQEMEFDLPALEAQRKIISIDKMRERQYQLMQKITILKNDYLNNLTFKLFQNPLQK